MKRPTLRLLFVSLFVSMLISPALAHGQFDVNASLYGQFAGTTSSNGVSQSPENSAGAMLGIRRYERPWRGYELTYSFNHANFDYSGTSLKSVTSNAHSVTADYVVSVKIPFAGIRPFALGGGGVVILAPQNSTGAEAQAQTQTKAAFSYGAGVEIRLAPYLGLRAQYRGFLYRAPDFGQAFLSTSSFTRTAEPVVGLFVRF